MSCLFEIGLISDLIFVLWVSQIPFIKWIYKQAIFLKIKDGGGPMEFTNFHLKFLKMEIGVKFMRSSDKYGLIDRVKGTTGGRP